METELLAAAGTSSTVLPHRGPKVDDLAEEWGLVGSCVDALSGVSDALGRGGEGMGGWRQGGRSQQRKQPRGSRQGPRGR
jgi:hypothetical protein